MHPCGVEIVRDGVIGTERDGELGVSYSYRTVMSQRSGEVAISSNITERVFCST